MRKILFFTFISLSFYSCKQSINDSDINKINGYWEIEKVELPNGNDKDYKVNSTIDYFEVKNNKGFRQKVMPQFDGTYLTNNIKEEISIIKREGVFFIKYSTEYGKREEQIIEIKDSVLVLKNKEDLEYHYKKSVPFSLK